VKAAAALFALASIAIATPALAQSVEDKNVVAWHFLAAPTAGQVASVSTSAQGAKQFGAATIPASDLAGLLKGCVVQSARAFGGSKPGYEVMWKCLKDGNWFSGFMGVVVPVGDKVAVSDFERIGFAPVLPPPPGRQ
jgi:hypothetical protein